MRPVSSIVTLPLVLPPSVLGFYLLVALGPHGPLGKLTEALGIGILTFTFPGLVIGSIVYSMPFAVQPLQAAFESIGKRPLEVAATLGARPWDAFWNVVVPLARPGFVTAALLTFAHTIGEFGGGSNDRRECSRERLRSCQPRSIVTSRLWSTEKRIGLPVGW